MARQTPSVVSVVTASRSTSGSSLSVTLGGIEVDDLIVINVAHGSNQSVEPTCNGGVSTLWVDMHSNGGSKGFYKRAAVGDVGTVTFVISHQSDRTAAIGSVIRGVDHAVAFDSSAQTNTYTSNPTPGSVSNDHEVPLLTVIHCRGNDHAVSAWPTSAPNDRNQARASGSIAGARGNVVQAFGNVSGTSDSPSSGTELTMGGAYFGTSRAYHFYGLDAAPPVVELQGQSLRGSGQVQGAAVIRGDHVLAGGSVAGSGQVQAAALVVAPTLLVGESLAAGGEVEPGVVASAAPTLVAQNLTAGGEVQTVKFPESQYSNVVYFEFTLRQRAFLEGESLAGAGEVQAAAIVQIARGLDADDLAASGEVSGDAIGQAHSSLVAGNLEGGGEVSSGSLQSSAGYNLCRAVSVPFATRTWHIPTEGRIAYVDAATREWAIACAS